METGSGATVVFGAIALSIAWPVLELALLVAQAAAKGDPARSERARLLAAGVKDLGRAVAFAFAVYAFIYLGTHLPARRPDELGETAARLMRAIPAFFGLCAFASAVMVLRCAASGWGRLRARAGVRGAAGEA